MYHYRFECRLNDKPRGNVKFVVEGDESRREDCVAIHNALIESPCIVLQSAVIAPMDETAEVRRAMEENKWIKRSETCYDFIAGPYVGSVELYRVGDGSDYVICGSAIVGDETGRRVLLASYVNQYESVMAAKRAVIQAIRRDIHSKNA